MATLDHADTFLSTYKQYKRDTEYIAGWLAETAKTTGYELRTRKAPMAKKKRSGKKKPSKPRPEGKEFIIGVNEFVPMAEAIAQTGSDMLVPVALSRVFNNAIQTRRKVANWFKTKVHSDDDSNKRHHYFITVLEDAFRVLRPHISVGLPKTARGESRTEEVSDIALENRFANLTVEEASDMADEIGVDTTDLPEVAKVVLEQDETELEEDLMFAVHLFFLELQKTRDVVREMWRRYQNATVDIIVATCVTEEAVKFAKQAEVEFDLVVSRPKKYPVETFPLALLLEELWNSADEGANAGNDIAFQPVHTALKMYLNKVKENTGKPRLPAIVPADFGSQRPHKDTLAALEYAQVIRLTMFSAKKPLVRPAPWLAIEDIFREGQLKVSNVFAVQAHVDTLDILGDRSHEPAFEFSNHFQHLLIRKFSKMQEFEDPFMPVNVYEDALQSYMTILDDAQDWEVKNGFNEQWDNLNALARLRNHPTLKMLRQEANREYMFKRQPLFCGLLKYRLYAEYHAAGMRHESQSMMICMMAQIYVTGRLLSPAQSVWPDMEVVLFAQNPQWLFFGGYPIRVEEARKKYMLAFGVSATNFAGDVSIERILRNKKVSKTGFHEFRESGAFGDGVFHRGNNGELLDGDLRGGAAVCKDMTERLFRLTKSLDSPSASVPWGRIAREMLQTQQQNDVVPSPKSPKMRKSPAEVLEDLAKWLQADTPDLYFDWPQMQRSCAGVLKAIDADLRRNFSNWQDMKRAKHCMDPVLDILLNDRFLEVAIAVMKRTMMGKKNKDLEGDTCLQSLAVYHRNSAKLLVSDGPLNPRTLHQGWQDSVWRQPWADLEGKTSEELRTDELGKIMKESMMGSFARQGGAEGGGEDLVGRLLQQLMSGI